MMNVYEKLRNAFAVELEGLTGASASETARICSALDRAIQGFEVTEKCTALAINQGVLPGLVKTYMVVKKIEGLSDMTLANYRIVLEKFFIACRKNPEEVTANDIRMFLYNYRATHTISDRTLDKYRETICWFFSWAHTEEYLSKNPGRALKPIKYEAKERKALSQIELEYLRMACKTKRDKAILEFLYSTGCRVSELCRVKRSDIDWHEKSVHLFGKGKKHRTSFINAKCEVALREYFATRDDESEYAFVTERRPFKGIEKESVEHVVREISKRAGLASKVTPHILRHTTATQAVNNGMPIEEVSKLLGHKSLATTMIYAKVAKSNVQASHLRSVI